MRPYRKERVASEVQHIVSDVILHRLSDPRIHATTTVTRVVMTGDLLLAKVYVSLAGGDTEERKTLQGLQHATGFIQRIVAEALNLRQAPALRFEIDESLKKVRHTLDLLEQNRRQHPEWNSGSTREAAVPGPMAEARSDPEDNGEDAA